MTKARLLYISHITNRLTDQGNNTRKSGKQQERRKTQHELEEAMAFSCNT